MPETRLSLTDVEAAAGVPHFALDPSAKLACSPDTAENFHPDPGLGLGARRKTAKRLCRRCDVQPACLGWALATKQPYGIWGGMTAHQRKVLIGQRAWGGA